jgi:GTP cyclohydrolase I
VLVPDGSIEETAEYLLAHVVGLQLNKPSQAKTAQRFVKALRELTTPEEFEFTTFPSTSNGMVTEKNMPFATLCEHHILPFMGIAHLAYIPNNKIVGISKIPRLVAYHAAGLNTQEELTDNIADDFAERFGNDYRPLGVAVIMEAQHTCMSIRGARASGTTRTAAVRGVFADHSRTAKIEFLEAIRC